MFIIVGDNPGDEEYEQNRYFVGSAGKHLRDHFEENSLCKDFDSQCILYNKTFISTTTTKELEDIKSKLNEEEFNRIQKFVAIQVSNLSNSLNLPVLIFGKSKMTNGGVFSTFWTEITSRIKDKNNLLVFGHPSHGHFSREWNESKDKISYNSNLDLLKKIGKYNREQIEE